VVKGLILYQGFKQNVMPQVKIDFLIAVWNIQAASDAFIA
jgi:hypothetical protein